MWEMGKLRFEPLQDVKLRALAQPIKKPSCNIHSCFGKTLRLSPFARENHVALTHHLVRGREVWIVMSPFNRCVVELERLG